MINSILLRRNNEHSNIPFERDDQDAMVKKNRGNWLLFTDPVEVVSTSDTTKVVDLLRDVETKVESQKLYAAGFISYEASSAFDAAFTAEKQSTLPLFCFGLFADVQVLDEPPSIDGEFHLNGWHESDSKDRYLEHLAAIKKHIYAGDTYQVNYTFKRRADYIGNPQALFHQFAKDAPYAAYLELDDFAICSNSPELFFSKTGSKVTTKPMKGTIRRGLNLQDDELRQKELASSEKDRAENIMIVDMIRNDLGRVAKTGSVKVIEPFQLEKYPTLWQMTSTVIAETESSCVEVISALFPCASITGAPKIETMKIIAELEAQSRGVYTGCIGYMAPGGMAQFSVAIRTAVLNFSDQQLNYGVGSGVVWDSDPSQEYEECLLKSLAVEREIETLDFELLETMLWQKEQGYFLLDYHLMRLQDSASYFDFVANELKINGALRQLSVELESQGYARQRVRMTISKAGHVHLESTPLEGSNLLGESKIVRLSDLPIDIANPFYYHKTTQRQIYEAPRQQHADCFDVLLWNEHNQITEFTIANFVLELDGKHYTPPVSCGLLNGTYRQYLIDQGKLEERIIYKDELNEQSKIYLINSVRQWVRVSLS